jgi:hypothetical protein
MTSSLKDAVLKDFWLKLFSLALATLIWFTVNIAIQNQVSPVVSLPLGRTEIRTFSNLPVLVVSFAQDSRNARINPKEVEVTVEGEAKVIKSLYSRDIRVFVDLTGIEAAHDMRKRVEVSTPSGVNPVKVDPPEVQVIFPPRSDTSSLQDSETAPLQPSNTPSLQHSATSSL